MLWDLNTIGLFSIIRVMAEHKTRIHGIDLNDVWRIGERKFVEKIEQSPAPEYMAKMIKQIKRTGRRVLGKQIIAVAEYGGKIDSKRPEVTVDDIYTKYPALGDARQAGLVSDQDVVEGTKKIKYIGDNENLISATCILPDTIRSGEYKADIPYGERVPIKKAVYSPRERESANERVEVERNKRMWGKLGRFFHFEPDAVRQTESLDFLISHGREVGKIIIPLRFASEESYFRVEDPSIEIGDNKRLFGHINIQAVSMFVKDDHGSRVIVAYYVGKKWKDNSWPVVLGMVKEVEKSIARAVEREGVSRKHLIYAGKADGNK